MKSRILIAAIVGALLAFAAHATVTSQSPTGFAVAYEADIAVAPQAAYDAFLKVGSWWNVEHSYSGEGKNFSIDVKPGGCWCETLKDGGFIRHMTVEQGVPGERLVFSGGLGPLAFKGVTGHMVLTIEAKDKGSHVKLTYAIGGHDPKDFKDSSKGVDAVLDEAFKRYTSFAVTGKP